MNTQPIQQNIQSSSSNIEQGYNSMKSSLDNTINAFSQKVNENADASSSFLSSNTIIAKFAFIVLIIIVFVILLNLGIVFLSSLNGPSTSPYLVDGMINGGSSKIITQDPKDRNAVPINRSNNESSGLEFTYTIWLYIDEIGQTGGSTTPYRHIFNKGDNQYSDSGVALNNGPGLYLESNAANNSPENAKLLVVMDSYKGKNEIEIDDIPIKKWVCVAIRAQNTAIDVYVNGAIAQRKVLDEVPKQNYYNIYVGQNEGFKGQISNLRYHSNALNIFELKQILEKGPNLNADISTTGYYNYLSNLWYSTKY
jgi:hypothetical protein|uniref:Uncharacterized protein n=1 Tax=viral metagenome TaxID=1070528 RepID=A0A6C0IMT4_9ZZZZ